MSVYHFTDCSWFTEIKDLITEYKTHEKSIAKQKSSVREEIKTIKDSFKSSDVINARQSAGISKLKAEIEEKKARLDLVKTKTEMEAEFWSLMGLRIIPLEGASLGDNKTMDAPVSGDCISVNGKKEEAVVAQGNFSFEFTRINPRNLSDKFVVKVTLTPDAVKIYETRPEDLFSVSDLDDIERRTVHENNNNNNLKKMGSSVDVRLLVMLLRHYIQAKLKM